MTIKPLSLVLGSEGEPDIRLSTLAAEEPARKHLYDNIYRVPGRAVRVPAEQLYFPAHTYEDMRDYEIEYFAVQQALHAYAEQGEREHGHVIYGTASLVKLIGCFAGHWPDAAGAWAHYAYPGSARNPPEPPDRKIRLVSVEIGPGVGSKEKSGLIATLRKISRGFKTI